MATSSIRAPIFVADESGDLHVFLSIAEAEGEVESPDVDEYDVYDSTGGKLRFLGKTEPTGRFIRTVDIGPVDLVPDENEPTHQQQLRALIIRGMIAMGVSEEQLGTASLEELDTQATEELRVPRRRWKGLFRRGRG